MGRPQKPYTTSWDETIVGLRPLGKGRWRITATNERFTEHDEYKAVCRFKQSQPKPETVFIPLSSGEPCENVEAAGKLAPGLPELSVLGFDGKPVSISEWEKYNSDHHTVGHLADKRTFWRYVRDMILKQPDLVAELTGIPQIASLASLRLPKEPLALDELVKLYRDKNRSLEKTKNEVVATFREMMNVTGAETLADLTPNALIKWKEAVESCGYSYDTRQAYFSRIRTIISFGLRKGLDAVQIRTALDHCQVMRNDDKKPHPRPTPISRDDFHKLLGAGGDDWRPWLLLGLNLCMHLKDICGLRWDEFDLELQTYASIRTKTQQHRIPQAATLWPETIEAMKALKRRGESPYVFTSMHGTKYNRNTRGNRFADLRIAANVTSVDHKGNPVSWDWIRDGAYTAAVRGAEEKWARLLAGHSSPGLQDNYVLRNPEMVKPACDAVYRHYFGKNEPPDRLRTNFKSSS